MRKDDQWPVDGLERVSACPVCKATDRTPLARSITDGTFCTAPGKWDMWRCADCRSGYLDPRPNLATIHFAYDDYYTHASPSNEVPARAGNGLLARLVSKVRTIFLPAVSKAYGERVSPPAGSVSPRLLDVGCGNGEFLARASEQGWQISGCDFDPQAVSAASSTGGDIRLGGPEAFADSPGTFDAVTLSHVIEHVHDPRVFLRECLLLLKPDGVIFIDTPNADALGLVLYGRHWRGLEAPRHLALFTWRSLDTLLREAGFAQLVPEPQRAVAPAIWLASDKLKAGRDPYGPTRRFSARFVAALILQRLIPWRRTEFVTIVARRPE